MKIEKLNFEGYVCGVAGDDCVIPIFYDCDRVDFEYGFDLFSDDQNNIMKNIFEYETMDKIFCD